MVACGAYIGTCPSEVCKRLGCDDMTPDVMDLSDLIATTLAMHLLYMNFTWDSVFVGLDDPTTPCRGLRPRVVARRVL